MQGVRVVQIGARDRYFDFFARLTARRENRIEPNDRKLSGKTPRDGKERENQDNLCSANHGI
jgi:hypothetical protein